MRTWPALLLEFPPAGTATDSATPLSDLVSATLCDLDVVAILELPGDGWHVCFKDEDHRSGAAIALRSAHGSDGLAVRAIDMDDEDWARRNQAALRAVRVGNICVAPPWDVPAGPPDGGMVTVVIEPAMGFGSGHHATTRLCLAALQRCGIHGRRVLDIGTGSGVLALAAARLGAASVVAIDIDADALENARDNAALNGRPPDVEFREADFRRDPSLTADVVVANLTGGMLIASAADVLRAVAVDGVLILSGVTAEEREQVLEAFTSVCRVDWSAEEDGWWGGVLRRMRPAVSSQ